MFHVRGRQIQSLQYQVVVMITITRQYRFMCCVIKRLGLDKLYTENVCIICRMKFKPIKVHVYLRNRTQYENIFGPVAVSKVIDEK